MKDRIIRYLLDHDQELIFKIISELKGIDNDDLLIDEIKKLEESVKCT